MFKNFKIKRSQPLKKNGIATFFFEFDGLKKEDIAFEEGLAFPYAVTGCGCGTFTVEDNGIKVVYNSSGDFANKNWFVSKVVSVWLKTEGVPNRVKNPHKANSTKWNTDKLDKAALTFQVNLEKK